MHNKNSTDRNQLLYMWTNVNNKWLHNPVKGFLTVNVANNGTRAAYMFQGYDGTLWTAKSNESTGEMDTTTSWIQVSQQGHTHNISDINDYPYDNWFIIYNDKTSSITDMAYGELLKVLLV